jgi:hypothetical protein
MRSIIVILRISLNTQDLSSVKLPAPSVTHSLRCLRQTISIYICSADVQICYRQSPSLLVPHPVSPKLRGVENNCKKRRCFVGETVPGKLLIFLLRTWVRVQANSFSHYFIRKKNIGAVTKIIIVIICFKVGFYWSVLSRRLASRRLLGLPTFLHKSGW